MQALQSSQGTGYYVLLDEKIIIMHRRQNTKHEAYVLLGSKNFLIYLLSFNSKKKANFILRIFFS